MTEQIVYTTLSKNGNSVVIESPDGVRLKWNNTYEERIVGLEEKTMLPVDFQQTKSATEREMTKFPALFFPRTFSR